MKRVWCKKSILKESLSGMAKSLGPGKQMPTMTNLCESLRVSNMTLHKILRELEESRILVRKHGKGIFVSPDINMKTIGVILGSDIFDDNYSPFWRLLLQQTRDLAPTFGFKPRVYMDMDIRAIKESFCGYEQLEDDLKSGRLAGLFVLMPKPQNDEVEFFREIKLPIVYFGEEMGQWRVSLDNETLISMATQKLFKMRCRRVGLLGNRVSQIEQVRKTLAEMDEENTLIIDLTYETWSQIIPEAGTRESCAYKTAKIIFSKNREEQIPDGIISVDDTMTRGILYAMLEMGCWPNPSIRFATSINQGSPVLKYHDHDMIKFEFDPFECVNACLTMLNSLMAGEKPETPIRIRPVFME